MPEVLEPTNVNTREEKDIALYLMEALPHYVFVRKQNKNNFYIYNDLQFYDITDQQQLNDYNFSIALTRTSTLGMGGNVDITPTPLPEDETIAWRYGNIVRKTFEFHIWSVNKSNIETSHMAEMTRLAMRGYKDTLDISTDINIYYKKLDNTLKPLYDCVFTIDILSQEMFGTTIDKLDNVDIEIEKVN